MHGVPNACPAQDSTGNPKVAEDVGEADVIIEGKKVDELVVVPVVVDEDVLVL